MAELSAASAVITGTVVEAGRPQANLDVTLSDAKGTAVKTVKTRDDGAFRFDGLAAGKYTVSAAKSASRRTARQPVAVEAGKTATVTLNLLR
ncbi:MAG: carboxypeptidase-like regulatory domain-containing protein [Gemmataceae bacterium]